MAKKRFGLEKLNVIDDGRVGALFDRLLEQATDDCSDRPHVKTARKVTLTVSLIPIPDSNKVNLQLEIKPSIPARHSSPVVMEVHAGSVLTYNDDEFDDAVRPTSATQAEED